MVKLLPSHFANRLQTHFASEARRATDYRKRAAVSNQKAVSKFTPSFTLIELLVVISLIGVLSAAVIVAINPAKRQGQARDAIRKQDMASIYYGLLTYFYDKGSYPFVGADHTASSLEPNWLSPLVPDHLKTVPKDPKVSSVLQLNAGVIKKDLKGEVAGVAMPSKSASYSMPVLVLKYFPTTDGVNIDSTITGITKTVADERAWVNQIKTETMQALQDGSKYHGYSNPLATPALNYSVYSEKEYLTTLPLGFRINTNPDIYRPDYMQILNNNNICDLVDNHGVREVWLFGWHYGNIEPVESNMAGPHGDWSNSEKTNDMPVCAHTYVLYNYNYDRSSDEATHDHGHQIEVVLKHFGDPLFESNFIGPFSTYGANDGSGANFHRCGWTHNPPNTGTGYDYTNLRYSITDCNDWRFDGSGTKANINCTQWQCVERKYHTWRWQNMPGRDNSLAGYTNWWDFIGDFDHAWDTNEKLVYDVTPPSVPTGLSANPIYSTQVTINWNVSTDDFGVAGYTIKRDGVVVGSTSTNTFVDYTVSAGQTYQYTVLATDTSQNASAESAALTVVTNNASAPSASGPILDSTSKLVGGGGSSYSWLHSVGNGPNRFLIVSINTHGGWPITVSSVTYNGVALSRLGYRDFGDLKSEFWKLKNPSTGLGTIAVNLVGTPGGFVGGASSWVDVDQVNPTGVVAYNTTYSATPSVTVTSSLGDMVVDTLVMPYVAADPAPTAGAGQNIFWNNYTSVDTRGMGSSKNASAGISTVMTWNTKNYAYSMLGVALKFGAPPIVVVPPTTPTPGPTPTPPPATGCPLQNNVYCYAVSAAGDSFVLWGRLEDSDDPLTWDKPNAICKSAPPEPNYYNYCVTN